VRFLFAAAFVGQMTVGVVSLAVPIYANLLGASPFLVGLIGSAGGLIYSFVPLLSGRLSDRSNRKAFLSVSLFAYGFLCLLYSFVSEPFLLVFIKALEWFSVATFWPALEALIVGSTDENLEGVLRKFNLSWGSAAVVSPVIGGVLISVYSVKVPFFFSALVSFVFGLLSLVIVKEPPRRSGEEPHMSSVSVDDGSKNIYLVVAVLSVLLFAVVDSINSSLFPSYALNLGIPPYEIGVILFTSGVARFVMFLYAARIESIFGKFGMFLVGSSTLALASFLVLNSYGFFMFTGCFLVFGFGSSMSYAASISLILGRMKSSRGTAAGLFESLIGVGYFVGPLVGGMVSEYALNAPYLFGLLLGVAVFVAQFAVSGRLKSGRGSKPLS
jgi:MFS family permease